ncbi:MAG TPA: CehA/McbA family metallohydrolase, partial [Steroidobacteraceae bacterium]|nr:CehA/McbA family metallohydrolase [Steroidobacteraceae bacterium]
MSKMRPGLTTLAAVAAALTLFAPAHAQWVNRYAKLSDFGHHVYLEQHELPFLAAGPIDPAPSPDGRSLAFAAQGWIWVLDLETSTATRLTDGAGVDSRPRWSPDSRQIAFVRDDGRDTAIVVRELPRGGETIVNTPTIELDPEFSADGEYLFYASAVGDELSLWRRHLASGTDERLTDRPQVERNARRLSDGTGILYLHGAGPHRDLRIRDFVAGTDEIAHRETLTYHLTADVHPRERLIVYSAPIDNAYHLWTLDLDDPSVRHRLTDGDPYAITPAFSADGNSIYFASLEDDRQYRLMRIPTYGGMSTPVEISRWDYGVATGELSVEIAGANGEPVTARVSITRDDGHPVAFDRDATFFDSQTGRYYFYVQGTAKFTVPAGRYQVLAAHGPLTPLVRANVQVRRNETADADLRFATPIWDASAAGYVSADYHVHLNGDGHHRADHDDALRAMAGEDLDQLSPMSWNRWERRIDRALLGKRTERDGRVVDQGQEVRSHFHGHIGLLGIEEPFAPWFFGPTNPTLGDPDLTNGDVFAHADRIGAFATYVHPVDGDGDPFADIADAGIPLELVSDGVLAERMGLELACAWTSPLGTAELWYRLLNIGRPIAAMSGTDACVDFHRTPAVGTGRLYVRAPSDGRDFDSVLEAAAAGKSFVTTGPALVFRLGDGSRPGDVTSSGSKRWSATVASTTDI